METTAVQIAALRGEIAVLTTSVASMRTELGLLIKSGDGDTSQKVMFMAEVMARNESRIESLETAVHSLELAPREEMRRITERYGMPVIAGSVGTLIGVLVTHWPF